MRVERCNATICVANPVNYRFQLYYDQDYQYGKGKYDYLHLVRSRRLFTVDGHMKLEEDYWAGLERNRSEFAGGLSEDFDLIVDPPSNSGYQRPFLSAFLRQRGLAGPCVRFIKETDARACPENLPELREDPNVRAN